MKLLIFALCMLLPSLAAAEGAKPMSMVLHTTDGQSVLFNLNAKLQITYSQETNLFTVVSGDKTFAIEIDKVVDCEYFSRSANAIDDVAADDSGAKAVISFDGETLTVSGARPSDVVAVYDMSGKRLRGAKTSRDGHAAVNIANLPQGVYIATAGKVSIKIRKGGAK